MVSYDALFADLWEKGQLKREEDGSVVAVEDPIEQQTYASKNKQRKLEGPPNLQVNEAPAQPVEIDSSSLVAEFAKLDDH